MDDLIPNPALVLLADQDQDKADLREWWLSESIESKMRLFRAITKAYDDPVMEVMSRFAQVAFFDAVQQYGLIR